MKLSRKELRLIIENELKQLDVNESAVGLVISTIVSLPKILEMLANLLERIGNKHHKEFINQSGEKLEHISHKLHKIYQSPIKLIVKKAYKVKNKGEDIPEDQLERITDIIFAILVACLALMSGAGAIKNLKHGHAGIAILEAGIGSIELIEEAELIAKLRNKEVQDNLALAINNHDSGHH